MSFAVVFGIGVVVVAIGSVAVVGLVIYGAVRSARDPEYRAHLEARRATAGSGGSSMRMNLASGAPYEPASDPGSPAGPMFPGSPDNPI